MKITTSRSVVMPLVAVILGIVVAGVWSPAAHAQGFGPPRAGNNRRPSVSPYIALAASNGGGVGVGQNGQLTGIAGSGIGAVNAYANITRPAMEQQRLQAQQNRLSGQVGRMQSQLRGTKLSAADLASGMLISPTGRAASFSNFSHYYPNKK